MKPENILDAIGNVDDNCIKKAKEKKQSLKKYIVSIGSLAACLALVIIAIHGIRKDPVIAPPVTQTPGLQNHDNKNPELTPPQYAFSYIKVYYSFNNISKIAPRQNTLEYTKMARVLEYIESIRVNKEGIFYKDDEWNYEVQEKDVSINCMDFENNLQAEYLLTSNSLFDYQTNTEYTLSEEEVKQLKELCIK